MTIEPQMKPINLQEYYPLIYKIVNKFDSQYHAELFNECYIQLDTLLRRFNASLGKFETYAYQRLYYCCVDFIEANNFNHESFDEIISNEDGEETRKIELLESSYDLELEFIKRDFFNHKQRTLTDVEVFIQKKYFIDKLPVKDIQRIYCPFHLIKSSDTIYQILKK